MKTTERGTHSAAPVEIPTGVAVFPKEMLNGRPPRTWVERDYHVVHWSNMREAGTSPASSSPSSSSARPRVLSHSHGRVQCREAKMASRLKGDSPSAPEQRRIVVIYDGFLLVRRAEIAPKNV
jgi:hypothetical protein